MDMFTGFSQNDVPEFLLFMIDCFHTSLAREIKMNEESYLTLLNKVLTNKEEERELALDRYRKADEKMETNDHFVVMGKNAVSYLRLASDTTNDMFSVAKEIKSVIYKDDIQAGSTTATSDQTMKMVIDQIKQAEDADFGSDDKSQLSDDDIEE